MSAAAIGIPWVHDDTGIHRDTGDISEAAPSHNGEAYRHMSTSELLEVYEQQQEELVKLSKELEDYTRKNIQLSTANLEHLQRLHSSNSPIMSQAIIQPPLLSQLASRVRQQQAQEPLTPVGDHPMSARASGPGAEGPSEEAPRPHSHASTEEGSREGGAEEVRIARPHGVETQEQAAAILMQMSQRMANPGAGQPP